jgi:hypothetical protein
MFFDKLPKRAAYYSSNMSDAMPDIMLDKGRKHDTGKPMMSLLPPHAMLAVGRVLTFGAQKYSKDNWKRVPSAKQRYMDAMMRHAFHFMSGEQRDSETGENHLAHLICCASFILDAAESGNDLPE